MIAPFLTAFSGFFAPEPSGRIFLIDTRRIKPAIEDFRNGQNGKFSQISLPF